MKALDVAFVRDQFPSLKNDMVFMDNAGGSQALGEISKRITNYFNRYNVQLGASYDTSANAGSVLEESTAAMANFMGCEPDEIIIGPSTTMLLRILSLCISQNWSPGDEVVVTNTDHEANVSCWNDLKERGIIVKVWSMRDDFELNLSDLEELLTEKTRLVAMVHASNILGTINPVEEVAGLVHEHGALLCVDGVAFAPHRMLSVSDWNVDFYVFSTYKTYGPHQAILYGKKNLLLQMPGLNHYFIGMDEIPYKFQPGNFNFELTYSLQAIPEYYESLASYHRGKSLNGKEAFQHAGGLIATHEFLLAERLLAYLETKDVRIIGNPEANQELRVPTISFIHTSKDSQEIVEKIDPFKIGIRFGDFYAKQVIETLGLVDRHGVVRISLVHYNTLEEVDRLIKAMDSVL